MAAHNVQAIAQRRDAGKTAAQVKQEFLNVMGQPEPDSIYQDKEDMMLLLALVDYVYSKPDKDPGTLAMMAATSCLKSLNRT